LTLIAGQENQMTETGVYQRVCQFDESLAFSSQGTKLSLEIISPLDLNNVWVKDKQTGDVCMWRRNTENKDIEHQERDRELITINEKTHSIQAISQNTPIGGQENQMMEIGVSQLVCQFDENLPFSSQ
jgi:hypothetical protein